MMRESNPNPAGRSATIVVVCWNQASATAACLAGLEETVGRAAPVIVVDNASSDNTPDVIREYHAVLDLKVLRNTQNLGFAKAVNQGIRLSDPSNDIVLLNNDVLPDPGWLQLLCDDAARHRAGITGCRMINQDGLLLHAGAMIARNAWWGIQEGGGEKDVGQFRLDREVQMVAFAAVHIRREVIRTIGLLDERFFAYFEDADYCLRAREAGFKIFCLGSLTMTHNQSASTRDNPSLFNHIFRTSQHVFAEKWNGAGILQPSVGVVWHSITSRSSGYALSSSNIIRELESSKLDVRYKSICSKGSALESVENMSSDLMVLALQSKPLKDYPVHICYSQADFFHKGFGRFNIGYTMLEVDGLPRDWVDSCNRMDEIWTPSTFNRHTFEDAGVRKPIRVMPLGIETEYFNPQIRPCRFSDRFTFLSIFEWGERKCGVELIREFLDEFRSEDALLCIKAFNNDPRTNILHELRMAGIRLDGRIRLVQADKEPIPAPGGEKVLILVNQDVPRHLLGTLYRGADCFVLPSRGEGWGLPVMEAMACDVPVIATTATGTGDFLNERTGFPVRNLGWVPAVARCPYYEGLRWAEPDFAHLRQQMRHVFEDREAARLRSAEASWHITTHYSREQCARPILERIRQIHETI